MATEPSLASEAAFRERMAGVRTLFRSVTRLESLHVHWYTVWARDVTGAKHKERWFFNSVVEDVDFSALRRCRLRGVHTTETSLLRLLANAA